MMFGLFAKISEYVWGTEGNEEANSGVPKVSLRNDKSESSCSPQKSRLKKDLFGKVTRLYDGAGVIEEDIYFTFDTIMGGARPEIGTEVHVEAVREKETTGWKAVRVQVMSEWNLDNTNDSSTPETFIGRITNVTDDSGVVDNDINFKLSCVRFGYIPVQGDWVKLDLEKNPNGTAEVRGVMPLREKNLTGVVTYLSSGFGYIDKEVFFSCGVCTRGYRPHQGDVVKATAIESKQGRATWRATKVEPKRKDRAALSPSPHCQIFMGGKMAELMRNKEELIITDQLDLGDVLLGESKSLTIVISNQGEKGQIFHSCMSVREDPQVLVQLGSKEPAQLDTCAQLKQQTLLSPGMEIPSKQAKQLKVIFTAKNLGRVNHALVFNFNGFEIGRCISASVKDVNQVLMRPSAPYQRNYSRTKHALKKVAESVTGDECIIPGERPVRKRKLFLPVQLGQYGIPRDIRSCILNGRDLGDVIPALREPLSLKNYAAKFSTLLYAEELQMEIDMREFDMERVNMNVCGEFLSLEVPGLSEGRPSLLLGDRVVASLSGSSSEAPKYEGYIHEVCKDNILLKFNEQFHHRFAMQECDVMFYFNRTTLRRAHRAVEFALSLGEEVLFPRSLSPKLPVVSLAVGGSPEKEQEDKKGSGVPLNGVKEKSSSAEVTDNFLYNPSLNERQKAAVCRILSGQCRPCPYLLFGPPGTGKTITVVEAILQIFHRIPSSRIVACTPSNSAADLIAERLHASGFIQEGDMVRLNAIQRAQDIPEAIEAYCTDTDRLDTVAHYRIIISTCSTAGQLYSLGLRAGHVTHVFVDEAGQATEPECLVAVGLAAGDDGQVILAGDPFQLGPVLQSRIAASYGLNISLLERLMSNPLYCRNEAKFADHGCYDPLLVTKLVNNYRSHPAVLKLPSAVFYHDELIPCADEGMRESLCQWVKLPNKGFPVIFHGLKGEDLREGNSPSWFNPVEAIQVTKYLQALRSSDKFSLSLSDIGVITPYRKQVEKLRLLLDRFGLGEVKVGSVEEFQGQERLVIIISTVRSNESLVGVDVRHSVGFLSNPKRFNVAITRAQALLVVIGNPHVLCQDPYWCCLVQYCVMNDAYVGCDLPSLDQQFLQEEFQEAATLLDKALSSEVKPQKITNEEAPLENKDATISNNNITLLSPQNPSENSKSNDLKEDLRQLVGQNANVTFYRDKFVSKSLDQESENSETESQSQKQNCFLRSSEDSSSISQKAVDVNHGHASTELNELDVVKKGNPQDLESDDELEEFVFQPRTTTK